MSSDRLSLLGMRFMARHGVLPAEKAAAQPFEVDVVLHLDLAPAVASDELADTVDYSTLHELVRSTVEGPSFELIEALAGAIANQVLAHTDAALVDAVEVRVRKPKAPIVGAFDTVEAALTRVRLP